jgi:hypothetical protein
MVLKKLDTKRLARSRVSLVPPSLNGALRGSAQIASLQEPWREHKQKGNRRGKRKK